MWNCNNYEDISKEIVLHDTPPYNSGKIKSLAMECDMILIPCKLMYPDLLALQGIVSELRSLHLTSNSVIFFNEVRKPHNNTYKELQELYRDNYSDIKHAQTELSNLVSFSRVLAEPLKGQALKQIQALVEELNISYIYIKTGSPFKNINHRVTISLHTNKQKGRSSRKREEGIGDHPI